jgi:hypothetical protein
MSRFRDFDAARAEHVRKPLSFRIGGEDFTVDGSLSSGILLDLGKAMVLGDDTLMLQANIALWDEVVSEDDKERFATALRRTDMATMIDLVAWIVEESTGRPLGSQRVSWQSPSTNGEPSSMPPGETVGTPSP